MVKYKTKQIWLKQRDLLESYMIKNSKIYMYFVVIMVIKYQNVNAIQLIKMNGLLLNQCLKEGLISPHAC